VIAIDIDPIAFSAGGFAIRWYGLIALLASAVAFVLVRRAARRAGISDALVADGAVWFAVVGLAWLVRLAVRRPAALRPSELLR